MSSSADSGVINKVVSGNINNNCVLSNRAGNNTTKVSSPNTASSSSNISHCLTRDTIGSGVNNFSNNGGIVGNGSVKSSGSASIFSDFPRLLLVSSLLLWVPQIIAFVYILRSQPFHNLLFLFLWVVVLYVVTVIVANSRKTDGVWLMLLAVIFGFYCEVNQIGVWKDSIFESSGDINQYDYNSTIRVNNGSIHRGIEGIEYGISVYNGTNYPACVGSSSSSSSNVSERSTISRFFYTLLTFFDLSGTVTKYQIHLLSRQYWVIVFAVHGVISGALCRAKDELDGRYYYYHAIGERMYIVVPFTIGQWCAFVAVNGFYGLMQVFYSIFLGLATVGYGIVVYRLMCFFGVFRPSNRRRKRRRNKNSSSSGGSSSSSTAGNNTPEISGLNNGNFNSDISNEEDGFGIDLITILERIFTTSFGVVFLWLSASICFVVYLAIPFIKSLLQLNPLVTVVGILLEIVAYENL